MTQATEVLIPSTPDEAARLFGDGTGVTVIGGGTIVLPDLTYGAPRPAKALLLNRAGLAGVGREGGTVTIGAATPIAELVGLPAPLGPVRRERRRRRDPLAGDARGQPVRRHGARRSARRPARCAARARRRRPLGGIRRRDVRAARGVPRPARLAAAARRELRRARRGRVRCARLSPHPRVHGARRVGRPWRRRHGAAGRDRPRRRTAGGSAPPRPLLRITRRQAPPRSRTSGSATTRSRPPGTGRRRCPCSSAAS